MPQEKPSFGPTDRMQCVEQVIADFAAVNLRGLEIGRAHFSRKVPCVKHLWPVGLAPLFATQTRQKQRQTSGAMRAVISMRGVGPVVNEFPMQPAESAATPTQAVTGSHVRFGQALAVR